MLLPDTLQFLGPWESITDLLLETVVPDVGAGFPCAEAATTGYLRLSKAYTDAIDPSEIPPYVAAELVLKLWDVVALVASWDPVAPIPLQSSAAGALKSAFELFGGTEREAVAEIVDRVIAFARLKQLDVDFKVRPIFEDVFCWRTS